MLLPRLWPQAAAQTYLLSNQNALWTLSANAAIALRGQWLFYGDSINLVHLWTVSLQEQFILLAVLFAAFIPKKIQPLLFMFMIASAPHRSPCDALPGLSHAEPLHLHFRPHRQLLCRAASTALAWRRGLPLHKFVKPAASLMIGGTLLWIAAASLQIHQWNGVLMATFGYTLQAAMLAALLLLLLVRPST